MKILLIFPSRPDEPVRQVASSMMPIAPTVLASLTPQGHDLKAIDMIHGDKLSFDEPADLVGLTVRTPMSETAYEIAGEFIKRGAKVVIGGPHTHALPEESATHADAVAIGEADNLWPVIVEDAANGRLKKYYIQGDREVKADEKDIYRVEGFPSLEGRPIPDRSCYVSKGGYMLDTIQTTRGCPHTCSFCPVPRIFGRNLRHRPIDDVVREVEGMKELFNNFDDSAFGPDGRDPYYTDLYSELAKLSGKRMWVSEGYPSVTTSEQGLKALSLAVDSGLWSLSMGIEAISADAQKQAKSFKKLGFQSPGDFDLKVLKDRLKIIKEHGVELVLWIVMGWDADTPDSYKLAADFCDEVEAAGVVMNLVPMQGTPIFEDYYNNGRIKPDFNYYDYMMGKKPMFDHPTMSYEQMKKAANDAMEQIYVPSKIEARAQAISDKRGEPFLKMASFAAQTGFKKAFTFQT